VPADSIIDLWLGADEKERAKLLYIALRGLEKSMRDLRREQKRQQRRLRELHDDDYELEDD
jgi:hypothetical protein